MTKNKRACTNILITTFRSILEVLDAGELEDCIDDARAKALEREFKKDIPLVFCDSSKRLKL